MSDRPAAGRQLAVGHQSPAWAVGSQITTNYYKNKDKHWCMTAQSSFIRWKIMFLLGFLRIMFRSLSDFSIVTQFLFPSISPGGWQMCGLVWRRRTLGEDADVSCQIERSTAGSVSSVLICHKCPLFPMAKDKGQRTYEEHAFLMWHSHQIHHSGLSRMPMTLYSSSNYSETMQQYECSPWRAHLPLTWRSLNSSVLHLLRAWTCELYIDIVVFDYEITCFSKRYSKTLIRRAQQREQCEKQRCTPVWNP